MHTKYVLSTEYEGKLQQNLCNHPRQDMKVARKLVLDLLESLSCLAGRVGKVASIFSSDWWKLHALTMQILLWECGSNPTYKGCWKWQHSRWGRNAVEHDSRLGAVLQRSKDYNLRLKRSRKRWSSIISHVFSHDGLKTSPEKVRAIVCFTPFPFFVNSVKVTCTPAVFVGIKGVLVQAY